MFFAVYISMHHMYHLLELSSLSLVQTHDLTIQNRSVRPCRHFLARLWDLHPVVRRRLQKVRQSHYCYYAGYGYYEVLLL